MRGQFGFFPNNFEDECTINIPDNLKIKKLCRVLLDCDSNVIVKGIEGVVQYVLPIFHSSDICAINVLCIKNRIRGATTFSSI